MFRFRFVLFRFRFRFRFVLVLVSLLSCPVPFIRPRFSSFILVVHSSSFSFIRFIQVGFSFRSCLMYSVGSGVEEKQG